MNEIILPSKKYIDTYNGGIEFSSNNKFLVEATNNVLNIWSIETGELIREYKDFKSHISSISICPSSQFIICSNKEGLHLFNIFSKEKVHFTNFDLEITNVQYTPDGLNILFSDTYGSFWKIDNRLKTFENIGYHKKTSIKFIDIHPSGMYAITIDINGIIKIWDIEEKKLLKKYNIFKGNITCIDYSKNGKFIAIGYKSEIGNISNWGKYRANSYNIFIINLITDKYICFKRDFMSQIESVRFYNDDKELLTGEDTGTFTIWDIKTTDYISKMTFLKLNKKFLKISKNSKFYILSDKENTPKGSLTIFSIN